MKLSEPVSSWCWAAVGRTGGAEQLTASQILQPHYLFLVYPDLRTHRAFEVRALGLEGA